jgi:hypothetical protein
MLVLNVIKAVLSSEIGRSRGGVYRVDNVLRYFPSPTGGSDFRLYGVRLPIRAESSAQIPRWGGSEALACVDGRAMPNFPRPGTGAAAKKLGLVSLIPIVALVTSLAANATAPSLGPFGTSYSGWWSGAVIPRSTTTPVTTTPVTTNPVTTTPVTTTPVTP